ncbi:hypothetical protein MPTK1_5g21250 [Marchantia polymorpha subsp. ruderalis]|uniref:Dipeptide epimerase n=2 Tax=Marchantia polymorpha TaxID=3197 RepID=A0A176WCD5_MARPO|nr:hypothetical protein AXG93_4908s1090 [Marchantia polymorpha subsp. ruderalis]PTQ37342.1 hypothetical protein MARPO_0058s0107 [Marchantia polymorpha]BBN12582.1 hypothetical protein Mp_5g21250 [Marchantia polymorpha subsp. ruderalis]|eukprot:PTQ37342.1 hypothetical protein MARPO_0058s0107 [Marchantia polymorpha]
MEDSVEPPIFETCSSPWEDPLLSRFFGSSSTPWEDSLESYFPDIVAAEATELNVPLLAPFRIATTKLEVVRNVAVRVALRDGSVGWGEIPTLPPVTAEDQPTALKKAREACKYLKELKGIQLKKVLEALAEICPGHEFSSVRAGLEMAVVDAVAHSLQLPLWKYFGGCSKSISTDITIPICPPEEAEILARLYYARGFKTIKTKVGGRAISLDIALLKAIRRGHPTCSLILDANGGYDSKSALYVLDELHEEGLLPCLFEQPVPREDWEGLGRISNIARQFYGVSVAADESCRDVSDAKLIIEGGLADVLNIKLAKMGLLEAMEIIRMVEKSGLGLMIGGMVETRLAMGFSAHLAAGLGTFSFIDLDTPLLLAEDPVHGGYEADGAEYKFTNDFGSGSFL